MTDNEIIKALNYCCGNIGYNDEECNKDMCYQVALPESRDGDIRWCKQWLIKDAIDLIDRQNAQIEALVAGQETLQKHITYLNAEIDRLEQNLNGMNIVTKNHIKVIITQAIKEFAERLKERADSGFWQEHSYVDVDDIDNLVEEMTEVSE